MKRIVLNKMYKIKIVGIVNDSKIDESGIHFTLFMQFCKKNAVGPQPTASKFLWQEIF